MNNKGFAISSIMYMILIMALILISATLSILNNRKLVLDKIRSSALENISSENNLDEETVDENQEEIY